MSEGEVSRGRKCPDPGPLAGSLARRRFKTDDDDVGDTAVALRRNTPVRGLEDVVAASCNRCMRTDFIAPPPPPPPPPVWKRSIVASVCLFDRCDSISPELM